MRRRWLVFGACAACAAFFAIVVYGAGREIIHQPALSDVPSAAPPSPGPASVTEDAASMALFPELNASAVTALCVTTEESSYTFRLADDERVSVNGQKADRDVFCTLLTQVLTLPVVAVEAFTPEDEAALTLLLSAGGAQYQAAFYRDDGPSSPYVAVISGDARSPLYLRTDAWRMGTLLLACEGTRIQDESGRETPMNTD